MCKICVYNKDENLDIFEMSVIQEGMFREVNKTPIICNLTTGKYVCQVLGSSTKNKSLLMLILVFDPYLVSLATNFPNNCHATEEKME